MMHAWGGGYVPGGYAFGFPWGSLIMGVFFIALFGFVVMAFIRLGRTQGKSADPNERGLEILVERFARGEIDAETFKAMKAEIDSRS
jgi:putative membrane protein